MAYDAPGGGIGCYARPAVPWLARGTWYGSSKGRRTDGTVRDTWTVKVVCETNKWVEELKQPSP
eukprot:1871695-Prymnesium_polylepis.1